MTIVIRPRRVHWPSLFWSRAESSFADCDLLCQRCGGSGTDPAANLDADDVTAEGAACHACRSSGLLVPARDLPVDIEALRAADAAGGWLDWLGHTGDGLLWPASWCWTISRRRFPIMGRVYYSDQDVMAFTVNGSVAAGLFRLDRRGQSALAAVFGMACSPKAEPPDFVFP